MAGEIDVPHINSRLFLFDRRRSTHPWFEALEALDGSGVIGEPEVTANWRMDPRVEDGREQSMLESGLFPENGTGGGEAFRRARRAYFNEHLCRPADVSAGGGRSPVYAADCNRSNRISPDWLSPNHALLHLASLNALLRRALSGGYDAGDLEAEIEARTGEIFPGSPTAGWIERVARHLQVAGRAATQRIAERVSETLGPTEPHWWAAFAHEVESHVASADWTGAAVALGLGHLRPGEWLLAWRYSPREAGPLYRPTVVETADNGFHFPSPPGFPYGITMPLADGIPMVRELVHAPLKGEAAGIFCTGRIGRIERSVIEVNNVSELVAWYRDRRTTHRQDLENQIDNETTRNWIARHRD